MSMSSFYQPNLSIWSPPKGGFLALNFLEKVNTRRPEIIFWPFNLSSIWNANKWFELVEPFWRYFAKIREINITCCFHDISCSFWINTTLEEWIWIVAESQSWPSKIILRLKFWALMIRRWQLCKFSVWLGKPLEQVLDDIINDVKDWAYTGPALDLNSPYQKSCFYTNFVKSFSSNSS